MFLELAYGALLLGSYVYHRWIEDHPKPLFWAIATPRVDEGAPVPLVYGRCRVRAPILAWAGSQRQIPRPNGRFAYFLDMLYVVGVPFNGGEATLGTVFEGDFVHALNSGESWPFGDAVIPGLPISRRVVADQQNFWVDNKPARVFHNDLEIMVNYGFIEFWKGTTGQRISGGNNAIAPLTDTEGVLRANPLNGIYAFLNDDFTELNHYTPDLPPEISAELIPSYRNQAVACLYHWCNGDGISLPSYHFEISSLSGGTASDLGSHGPTLPDADPAAVIYDLLTSPWSKLALPTSKVDLPSFQAASATLYAEQHGYSRSIEGTVDANEIIGEVLRQIDGVLYEEPTTGKLVLRLIRNDYDTATLDSVTPDNARPVEGSWLSVSGWSETLNQVRVTFTDRQNFYADGQVVAMNTANVVAQGGKLRSVDIHFPGCCTQDQARRLASRELAVMSRPFVKASVICDRSFYAKRPGDAVKLTWPQLGIAGMAMRIARIDLGQLHKGEIHLDLIRDVFDVSLGAFPVPT